LAVATIACLGRGAATDVPLASLLQLAMAPAGRAVAAVAALILTLGATNAYLSGATEMISQLTGSRRRTAGQRRTADRQQATDRTKATGQQQATDRRTVAGQQQVTGPRRAAGRRAEAGRPTGFLLIIAATGLALI